MYVLSEAAAQDLERLVEESWAVWGPDVARKTEARLTARFERVGDGSAGGYRRRDVPLNLALRFLTEEPFVIAFDPATRTIVRVLYGRSDIAGLFRR